MNHRPRKKISLQLIAALCLGLGASVTIFAVLEHFERFRTQAQFRQLADQRLNAVRTRVAEALDTIRLVASHFEASQDTSRRAFTTLVEPALASHRYLQALEWIPRVATGEQAEYERLARQDGLDGFRFTERRQDGSLAPVAERSEYFPVFYVEPVTGNERALGYDLASDRVRREGLEKARRTGSLVATARVQLVQERGDQYGVLIFAPAYNRADSPNREPGSLKGFALGVLRIGDLIAGATESSGAVAIHVFDISSAAVQQLYPKTPEVSLDSLRGGLHVEGRFEVDGRTWALLATPGGTPTDLAAAVGPFLVLAFGLLLTTVFVFYLKAKATQALHIAEAAEELSIANQRLETHAVEIAEQAQLAALSGAIGVVLTKRENLADMLEDCAGVLVDHLHVAFSRIWTLCDEGNVLELQASAGMYTHIDGGHARIPLGNFKIGRIAQDRRPHLTNSVIGDPEVSDQAWASREGMVAFAGYPLVVEDRLVGVVALFARRVLPENVLKALASIADEIALGIERKKSEEALRASEQRFRIAAENGSDVIVVRDMLTNQTSTSGAEQKLLPCAGKMPGSFEGFQRLLHPDDRERVRTAIETHLETGLPYRAEFRVIDQDGSVRHWSARGAALRNASGRPTQFVAVTTDITEQKETEAALSHLAAIVEFSEASIISIDLQGTILTWNPAAERIYGYSGEEAIGRSVALIYPQNGEPELQRLLQKMHLGKGTQHIETVRIRKNGEPIPVFATYSPLRDSSGTIIGACSIANDMTERKLLERQLAQAQKLESIGQLASGIAHEINTPIQYVGDNIRFLKDSFARLEPLFEGYEELLASVRSELPAAGFVADLEALAKATRASYLRAEIPRSLEDSLEGIGRVAEIVRAMKEFSHPGPLEKIPLDINRAIESTVLVSRNEWKYASDLHTEFDPNLPPVMCVPGEFNQVVLNLIVNAAHSVADVMRDKPGQKGSIVVSTHHDGGWAEVRVKDTGTGIPEEIQASVFNPFFTTKGVGKGTGQGLAIAYSVIVRKHGGTISFDTAMGGGTTFRIRLPIDGAPSPASDMIN